MCCRLARSIHSLDRHLFEPLYPDHVLRTALLRWKQTSWKGGQERRHETHPSLLASRVAIYAPHTHDCLQRLHYALSPWKSNGTSNGRSSWSRAQAHSSTSRPPDYSNCLWWASFCSGGPEWRLVYMGMHISLTKPWTAWPWWLQGSRVTQTIDLSRRTPYHQSCLRRLPYPSTNIRERTLWLWKQCIGRVWHLRSQEFKSTGPDQSYGHSHALWFSLQDPSWGRRRTLGASRCSN